MDERTNKNETIAIAGMGYVGSALALVLAAHYRVVAYDCDPAKIEALRAASSPIENEAMQQRFAQGGLDIRATADAADAFRDADYVVLALPTDYDEDAGSFDTSAVSEVAALVRKVNPHATMVVRSTVPIGFTQKLAAECPGSCVLFSPEFLREASALEDSLKPSRIVVGAALPEFLAQAQRFAELLQSCTDAFVPALVVTSSEAEAIKLFSNAYLASRVAFFNELDTYASSRQLDAGSIIAGVTLDPRIGRDYCNPSFGFGGYCLPKDTKQLVASFGDVPQSLISSVLEANKTRKAVIVEEVADQAQARADELGRPVVVGIFRIGEGQGAAGMRTSSVLDVVQGLQGRGLDVLVYEPALPQDGNAPFSTTCDLEDFLERCDLVVANRWDERLASVGEKVFTRDIHQHGGLWDNVTELHQQGGQSA